MGRPRIPKTYQRALTIMMGKVCKYEGVMFLGQGITTGERIYHTMDRVPLEKCIEMPIAEDLMVGMAIGMALEGFKPIVIFQRMDFMTVAMDQIVNHLDKINKMSNGQFKLPITIRAIVGASNFNAGLQHTQDFTSMLRIMLKNVPVVLLRTRSEIGRYYHAVHSRAYPVILVEKRDYYDSIT